VAISFKFLQDHLFTPPPLGALNDAMGAGPRANEGETTLGGRRGSVREGKPVAGARRRFSAGDPVPGGWGGGVARVGVGVGGQGGGFNLTGGHTGWSVHGEVAAPAAARSPVRLLDVIGEGERRTELVARW
jgi:hypothetical protein